MPCSPGGSLMPCCLPSGPASGCALMRRASACSSCMGRIPRRTTFSRNQNGRVDLLRLVQLMRRASTCSSCITGWEPGKALHRCRLLSQAHHTYKAGGAPDALHAGKRPPLAPHICSCSTHTCMDGGCGCRRACCAAASAMSCGVREAPLPPAARLMACGRGGGDGW